jgi:ribA/ribD-fused uncharacterized protein
MSEQFTFFADIEDTFSQWHPSVFTVDGVTYNCAEQYMMHQKALLFNDPEAAARILSSKSPRVQQGIARSVKNFNESTWREHRLQIVHDGNIAKYLQNEGMKQELFATAERR